MGIHHSVICSLVQRLQARLEWLMNVRDLAGSAKLHLERIG